MLRRAHGCMNDPARRISGTRGSRQLATAATASKTRKAAVCRPSLRMGSGNMRRARADRVLPDPHNFCDVTTFLENRSFIHPWSRQAPDVCPNPLNHLRHTAPAWCALEREVRFELHFRAKFVELLEDRRHIVATVTSARVAFETIAGQLEARSAACKALAPTILAATCLMNGTKRLCTGTCESTNASVETAVLFALLRCGATPIPARGGNNRTTIEPCCRLIPAQPIDR